MRLLLFSVDISHTRIYIHIVPLNTMFVKDKNLPNNGDSVAALV